MESLFLLQVHKENLIRDACHYITYHNHGDEEYECTKVNGYTVFIRKLGYGFSPPIIDFFPLRGLKRVGEEGGYFQNFILF